MTELLLVVQEIPALVNPPEAAEFPGCCFSNCSFIVLTVYLLPTFFSLYFPSFCHFPPLIFIFLLSIHFLFSC
jgi:hypothetical protein